LQGLYIVFINTELRASFYWGWVANID